MSATSVKAVLVAGGKGTRIRPVAGAQIPKGLVPVGGVPIAARVLRLLARHGVRQVAVCAGHLAESLRQGLAPYADECGIEVEYFVESAPLGTAGCLPQARAFLGASPFFVVYGDVMVDMDLSRLLEAHDQKRATATVVVHGNDHPQESDLVEVDADGRITRVLSREGRPDGDYRNLVPAAVYCASPALFDYIDGTMAQDFVRDVFPRMAREQAALFAYNTPEYLRDMGTPGRFAMVERNLASGLVERMNWSHARPAVFLDRDGVLNEDLETGVFRPDALRLLPGAAAAVRAINDRGALAVVVTNQPHVAKGFVTRAGLEQIHGRLEMLLGREGAKVDRIFYCPHHPDGGFAGEVPELKRVCACRKPSPGLLLQAAAELPVKMEESCLIGDTWRDVGAARAAGVRTYGVRTGRGCKGCHADLRPDLMFSDVLEAVQFALDGVPIAAQWAQRAASLSATTSAPIVVGVCGRSRAGKSAFAHALAVSLRRLAIPAIHVRLDDWILPASGRRAQMSSDERCRTQAYPGILEDLRAGRDVTVDAYDPETRECGGTVTYRPSDSRVVILDGLWACHPMIRGALDLALMVEADQDVLASRFREFYLWKGDGPDATERLLAARAAEEWPAVDRQRAAVDAVIPSAIGAATR